jgi:nicotinamide mononucleotide (NMN) deamidase PncC
MRFCAMSDDFSPAIERIRWSGKQCVIAVTGGGSGAISALLSAPGASGTVLEAIVPYHERALEEWIGGRIEQACSPATARAMAMAAFQRAVHLSDSDHREQTRGVGCTASLATNRPKRGPNRIHVAWQSAEQTDVMSVELNKGARSRTEEEQLATQLVLTAIAEACSVQSSLPGELRTDESLVRGHCKAPVAWTELLLGERTSVMVTGRTTTSTPQQILLFPGAFHPLHAGHRQMARVAEAKRGVPVTFELSITNVDKPPLDFIEIRDRLDQFPDHNVQLTRAATFVEKAAIAPGATFVVGADTVERVGDVAYYDNVDSKRDAAIESLAQAGCRFLVFGRESAHGFRTQDALEIPPALRRLCEGISEAEFRTDLASTQLRADGKLP